MPEPRISVMNAVDKPSFETDDHARVFRHVEQSGAVGTDELHDRVRLDADRVDDIVTDLERDGYLSEVDGALQVVVGARTGVARRQEGSPATVRLGRQDNLSATVETIRRVVSDVRYPKADSLASTLDKEGVLHRYNGRGTRVVFTATVDGETVGWVHLAASPLQRLRRTAEGTLGVRAEFRGRGIGSHLLRRGCEWAASNGFRKACQRLPATNDRAVAFLETRGWERDTVRKHHYDLDGERTDEVTVSTDL